MASYLSLATVDKHTSQCTSRIHTFIQHQIQSSGWKHNRSPICDVRSPGFHVQIVWRVLENYRQSPSHLKKISRASNIHALRQIGTKLNKIMYSLLVLCTESTHPARAGISQEINLYPDRIGSHLTDRVQLVSIREWSRYALHMAEWTIGWVEDWAENQVYCTGSNMNDDFKYYLTLFVSSLTGKSGKYSFLSDQTLGILNTLSVLTMHAYL